MLLFSVSGLQSAAACHHTKHPRNHWHREPDSALMKTVCVTATKLRWPNGKTKCDVEAGRGAHCPRVCGVWDRLLLCWSSSPYLIFCCWEYTSGLDLPCPLFLPRTPKGAAALLELQWQHFLPLAEHLRRAQELSRRKEKPFILVPEIIFLVSVSKGHFREPQWAGGLGPCGRCDLTCAFHSPTLQVVLRDLHCQGTKWFCTIFPPTFLLFPGHLNILSQRNDLHNDTINVFRGRERKAKTNMANLIRLIFNNP